MEPYTPSFYESRKFGISEEERAAEDTRIKQLTFSYLEFDHIELAPESALLSSMMFLFLCRLLELKLKLKLRVSRDWMSRSIDTVYSHVSRPLL